MKKYKYEVELTEKDQADADLKMAGLMVLAAKLTPKETDKLAQVVKNDPVKTSLAKKALGL